MVFRVVEIVNGLGAGGAEKSLANRLKYTPPNFRTSIVNFRPRVKDFAFDVSSSIFPISSNFPCNLFDLFKLLQNLNASLIIVRTPRDVIRIGIISCLIRRRSWKVVYEAHSMILTETSFISWPLAKLFNFFVANVDLTIAVSKSISSGSLCKRAKRVQVQYLGSDLQVSQDSLRSLNFPRLLFVGRLIDLKRPLWLLRQIQQLAGSCSLPTDFLTIVGDGPLQKELVRLISSLDLSRTVKYEGFQKDIVPFLLSSTHLISTSITEGLPITFYEAKLAGMKIISTPFPGAKEILGPKDFLLEDFSSQSLLKSLRTVLDYGGLTKSERLEIRKESESFKTANLVPKYYKTLEELIEE